MNSFEKIGFRLEVTEDQSPTLRIIRPTFSEEEVFSSALDGESMHHSGGALSETKIIYGETILQRLQNFQNDDSSVLPRFLIVGLGLGYIEMFVAAYCIEFSVPPEKIWMQSFESNQALGELFVQWLRSKANENKDELSLNTYNEIASKIAQSFESGKVTSEGVRQYLRTLQARQSFVLGGAIENSDVPNLEQNKFDCILYDAFSAKTNPALWSDDYLLSFFKNWVRKSAYFSTYACRGSLKRSLKQAGFDIEIREGFKGKRNSTRAQRS